MADAFAPVSVPVSKYQPDPWTGTPRKAQTANLGLALPYGRRQRPAGSDLVPWTEIVRRQGSGDWAR